jgi:DNA (cytosine-5)-methyltransferase 1
VRTIADFFAGVGGLSLGFTDAGFRLVLASDNDKWASTTFRKNHVGVPFLEKSIEDVTDAELRAIVGVEPIDVLVGGVPCQAFSMAGYRNREARRDVVDDRVYLFRHYLRVAKSLMPKVVVVENVKGLPSMLGGRVLEEMKGELEELGYVVDWKILNAADYGAAQLRERFVLVANRIGVANRFPPPTRTPDQFETVGSALRNVPPTNHEPRTLQGVTLERVRLIKQGENWRALPAAMQTRSLHSGAYGRLRSDSPAKTLLTRFDSPPVGYVTHPEEDRALTVREGARLQGFPDTFTFFGPKMNQYRQVGNAVSPIMSTAIARSVAEMLNEGESDAE